MKNKSDIFRLAAVLYADSNDDVSTEKVYRRIIESIFIDNENKKLTLSGIIELINKKYSLIFSEEDIIKYINYKGKFIYDSNNIIDVNLEQGHFKKLKEKTSNKDLEYYIGEFCSSYKLDLNYCKNIIYKFLYDKFQVDINGFSKLLKKDISIEEKLSVKDIDFEKEDDINIINNFLDWENEEKNIIIYNIASLSLEYCFVSNKINNNFNLSNLKNKNIYLDSNIIFRAMGINGKDRKKQVEIFLEKFKESEENLFRSLKTEQEINETIRLKLKHLNRENLNKYGGKIFKIYTKNEDFISYYYNWIEGKRNTNVKLFESYIKNEFQEVLRKYNIKIDRENKLEEKEYKDIILDTSSNIKNFKGINNSYVSSEIDANNILLIEKLRNKSNYNNLFDCKYFMISTDQKLIKWYYITNKNVPAVILPSQWMSILLRYLGRSKDDFKSFVSFLNIRNRESILSNEKLTLIIESVFELTTNIEQANGIVYNIINSKFLEENLETTDNEIKEKVKEIAKSELESRIEDNEKRIEALENQSHNDKKVNEQITREKEKLERENKELEKKNNEKDNKIYNLENRINKIEISNLRKWKYFYIILIIILLVIIFFAFFFISWRYNPISYIINWMRGFDEQRLSWANGIITSIVASGIYLSRKKIISINKEINELNNSLISNNISAS